MGFHLSQTESQIRGINQGPLIYIAPTPLHDYQKTIDNVGLLRYSYQIPPSGHFPLES